VIATGVFLGAGTIFQHLSANRDVKVSSTVAPAVPSVARVAESTPVEPSFQPHPFAKFVEVTGLRVVMEPNRNPQVQYIVVNHASSQLTGMAIHVAVRSTKKPAGAPPLFTVSAVVPSLGPHESKEIRTDLDSDLRSGLPGWEFLRTDVQIGVQN
jgi:hypothetical protein